MSIRPLQKHTHTCRPDSTDNIHIQIPRPPAAKHCFTPLMIYGLPAWQQTMDSSRFLGETTKYNTNYEWTAYATLALP